MFSVVAWLPKSGTTSSHLPCIVNNEYQGTVGQTICPIQLMENKIDVQTSEDRNEFGKIKSSVLRLQVYPVQNGHIAKTIIKTHTVTATFFTTKVVRFYSKPNTLADWLSLPSNPRPRISSAFGAFSRGKVASALR